MKVTVGHAIAAFLERCGVRAAFGVISIHNMPILDAMAERKAIRFVPARGEAGATNMADACARVARFLPVLDRQLDGRDYIVGPLSIADFDIGPRLDRAPELLNIDMAPYPHIEAWRDRLRAKPYWATA